MSLFNATSSLRERQVAHLKRMLCLNSQGEEAEQDLVWKVLILDSKSTKIISSVLRVNDLLEYGITVHSLISQRRAVLADVPVVYFVQPTLENVSAIIKDIENDQYSSFYINFTSSLSRSLLEDFAKRVASTGKADRIKQVWDQYLDFIVTEPNLFSLECPKIYSTFNSAKTSEDEINAQVETIAQGLFSEIVTMGPIPIIRANRNGPAELISQRLDQKLRDHVINTRQQHSNSNNEKSVFVLLDRDVNLQSMFAHSWIYQCMVSDVFNLQRNTISIEKDLGNGKKSIKRFDIEPKDFFWNSNASLPFPDAVENVELELNQYTQDAKDITAKTGYSSIKDIDPSDQKDTQHIQEAIKALPELTHRKSIIDTHMSVLSELIKELQSKSLDSFFEIEQNVNDKTIETQFKELLNDKSNGDNKMDKLRTYVILFLSKDLTKEYCDECEKKLELLGCNLSPLSHIKKVKDMTKMTQMQLTTTAEDESSNSYLGNRGDLFSNISSKLLNLDGSGKISEGFGTLVNGLKKLLPAKTHLPITNITESIMNPQVANQQSLKLTDDYLYFDPNITRGSHSKQPKRSTYNECTVFVVGGGNYLEYSNLQDWCNDWNLKDPNSNVNGVTMGKKRVVCYGSTSLITADEFLEECSNI